MNQIRKLLQRLLTLLLVAGCSGMTAWADDTNKPPVNTSDGYYEISTPAQMKWYADFLATTSGSGEAANVRLMNDISLSSLCSATTQSWTPLGDKNGYFYGTFDGQGHSVTDLYINQSATNYRAFIASLYGTLKNVKVSGSVTGGQTCGLVVGYLNTEATLDGCESSGSVNGTDYVGGIVGQGNSNVVTNCINRATVTASGRAAGGIVGSLSGGFKGCFNYGNISAQFNAGGIAGSISAGSASSTAVTYCGNLGNISVTNDNVGGIAGSLNTGVSVSQCYDIGTITGSGSTTIGVITGSCNGTVDFNSCCCLNSNLLYLSDASAPLTNVYAGGTTDAPMQWTAEYFQSGFVARSMNNPNGADGLWRQTFPDDVAPLLTGKKVYVVSADVTELYGNEGQTLTLPESNEPDGLKIYKDKWVDENGTSYATTYTVGTGDAQLSPVKTTEVVVDMSAADHQTTEGGLTYFKLATEDEYRWWVAYVNADPAHLSANAQLTTDIHITNKEVESIAPDAAHPYTGTFDGKGYKISDLFLKVHGDYEGLFGANAGTVRGLQLYGTLDNASYSYTGGIAGINVSTGVIEQCFVSFSIFSTGSYLGGIAGSNEGTIRQCQMFAVVGNDATTAFVGGIAGENAGSITDCGCSAVVTGQSATTGQLIGAQTAAAASLTRGMGANFSDCSALIGQFTGGTIAHSYYYNDNTSVTPVVQSGVTSVTSDTYYSGLLPRLLNGGDGTAESATGVWGQTITASSSEKPEVGGEAVYRLTAGSAAYYGNTGATVTFPASSTSFDETKIIVSSWKDASGQVVNGTATFASADIVLTAAVVSTTDMSSATTTTTDASGHTFFLIDTAEKMKWFAYYVNLSTDATHRAANARLASGQDFYLSDCDADHPFPVIAPDAAHPYAGIFDGVDGSTTLYSFTLRPGSGLCGLFGANAGQILHVTLMNVTADATGCDCAGSLVGINLPGATVSNCDDLSGSSTHASGVLGYLVGRNEGVITASSVLAHSYTTDETFTASPTSAGGIAGTCEQGGSLADCLFYSSLSGLTAPGALAGTLSGDASSVSNCLAEGDDDITSLPLVSQLTAGRLTNCYKVSTAASSPSSFLITGATQTSTELTGGEATSGRMARLLNGGDGTTEKAAGLWGQDLSDASVTPFFLRGDDTYRTCLLTKYLADATVTTVTYVNPGTQECADGTNALGVLDATVSHADLLGTNVADASGQMNDVYLNDAQGFQLPSTPTLKALSATYDGRTFYADGHHETFCIPFDADIPEGFTFWQQDGAIEDNTVRFTEVTSGTLVGGRAYLAECTDASLTASGFNGYDVTLRQPEKGVLQGSYLSHTATDASNTYILGVYSDEEMFKLIPTGTKLKPFRCFLDMNAASSKTFKVNFGGTTAVKGIKADSVLRVIYDLQGNRIVNPEKGHIYIIDGRKVRY